MRGRASKTPQAAKMAETGGSWRATSSGRRYAARRRAHSSGGSRLRQGSRRCRPCPWRFYRRLGRPDRSAGSAAARPIASASRRFPAMPFAASRIWSKRPAATCVPSCCAIPRSPARCRRCCFSRAMSRCKPGASRTGSGRHDHRDAALLLQNEASNVPQVSIHPAASLDRRCISTTPPAS